ncbi:TolC family protein [Cylindrospermum sp. FACHB-282]|uniref:TolC family protein n=1 Tax=Cylindrospermum sp. FACHB-282 TaxID=2692794 RepID=UPI001683C4AB|nr:TolC family protein [Cylindrospermum sp. FACHB-282]MBD2384607.1 TolC family protein [Cylindrospermum sp. FACHB-282]
MNHFLFQGSSLFLLLTLLFPSLGKCQDIPSQEKLKTPIVSSATKLQILDNSSNELPLNLADAVYLALENNRDLKLVYLQRILDKKQLAETESQFNPKFTPELSLNFNNSQSGENRSNNQTANLSAKLNLEIPTGANLSLTLQGQSQLSQNNSLDTNMLSQSMSFNFSQPLLRGFGTRFNTISIKRARLTEKVNILTFKNNISQTITDTILSYRDLLLAQERLKIEQLSVASSKKDLERLQALFEFGRIAKNNLIERQSDIAQKEVDLVNTQGSLEQAIADLNKLLDLPVPKKLIAIETPITPATLNLPSFAEMLELALANNSGYLSALNGVEDAKFGINEAENQQKLDLQFNLSYGFNSATNTQDTGDLNSSFTLSREFGNLSQNNAVKKSQIGLQSANLTYEKAKENLNEELKTKIRNSQDTFKQIKLAQQARQLAETKVINAKERMRLGSNISMTDIIDFEKSLVDAKNQELSATINHLNSITQLEQFLGITLNQWVKQ